MSSKQKTVKLATMRSNIALLSSLPMPEKEKIDALSVMYKAKSPDGIDVDGRVVQWADLQWAVLLPPAERAAIDAAAIMSENAEMLAELNALLTKATALRDTIADLLNEVGYTLPVIARMTATATHAGGGVPLKRLYEEGRVYVGVSESTTGLYGIRVDSLVNNKPSKVTVVNADGTIFKKSGFKTVYSSFPEAARAIVIQLCGRSLPKTGGLNAPREFGVPKA